MNGILAKILRGDRNDSIRAIGESLAILSIAIGVGLAIVGLSGGSPIAALQTLAYGAFGTSLNLSGTIVKTVPLLLTGLSVAFAFRAGLFNIGGEGQLYAGAIGAAWVGSMALGVSPWIHLPLTLLVAAVLGACWGGIAGWVKARRGVHEVINTIMLNYIAIYAVDYLVRGPLSAGSHTTRSRDVVPEAHLPVLWETPPIGVSVGVFLAFGLCLACYWILFRTSFGIDLRTVGQNADAAETVGISSGRVFIIAMLVSGAITGIAGFIEITGVHHTLYAQFSPGYGFDGIAVALLGRSHPVAVVPAALLFGALRTADRWLQLSAGVPKDIVIIIQAIAILAVGLQSARASRR